MTQGLWVEVYLCVLLAAGCNLPVWSNAAGRHHCIVMQTNKGDGTFQQADSYCNPAISPSFLAVQDIDNDGRDDIVTANGDSISVSLGKGNGTFHNPITSTVSNATSLAIGDFNHDGMNDIAVIGNNTNSPTILLGSGNGRNGD